MPTESRSSIARSRARRDDNPQRRVSTSVNWRPIFMTGLREDIGSWKIIAISRPRTSRISPGVSWRRSRPSKTTLPWYVTEPSWARMSMMERDRTLLPEPDSPTMPSTRPCSSSNDTPSTARAIPLGVTKWVERSSTSSSGGCSREVRFVSGSCIVPQPVCTNCNRATSAWYVRSTRTSISGGMRSASQYFLADKLGRY